MDKAISNRFCIMGKPKEINKNKNLNAHVNPESLKLLSNFVAPHKFSHAA